MSNTSSSSAAPEPHLLLIAGVGGLSAEEGIAAARGATSRVSVAFVTAWGRTDAVRAAWRDGRPGEDGSEFLAVPDLDSVVAAATGLHGRSPIDGVVTYSELLLRPQAELADRLGLPGNSPESVARAQSKALQRRAFAAAGVPSPRAAEVRRAADLPGAVAAVGLPAVFKPSLGAGSQGVRVVTDEAELAGLLAAAADLNSPFLQEDDAYLLEEAMPIAGDGSSVYADYVSVESLLFEGVADHLAVTDRLRLRNGCVEEGAVLPSRLPAEARRAAVDCADRAIRALGLTHGAVHTEVALCPDGAKVIEVNARAGGPLPSMFLIAADYDFARDIARVALGLRPLERPVPKAVAWVRYVPIPAGEWRVVAQRSAEEARAAHPDLLKIGLRFAPGGETRRDVTQHLVVFTVRGADLERARTTAEAVERFLDIRLEPLDPASTPATPDPLDPLDPASTLEPLDPLVPLAPELAVAAAALAGPVPVSVAAAAGGAR
ncbi:MULTISPECIES: ATP-grasp domain-containing protein [Kitasatospora]|uniref:ATP-grasp domain-containing protein n=1 Tax=Kitasatospora setae (strain ATCC 33774 / DSM 43861 / JCM 3304 / KCC A-0304 / NBRC 14216 / KM-6054) TaxID=452652 RepID=E4N0F7_KITSK|nr:MULTISPECIES: ATP-grasp domain-containing protein [Kitasatospora]BAJ31641.1 hypothetical protein KSE_58710 [Kitasatospora setae KM-6054]